MFIKLISKLSCVTLPEQVSLRLEELTIGWFHDKGVAESFPKLGGGGLFGTFCVMALFVRRGCSILETSGRSDIQKAMRQRFTGAGPPGCV
jgi:hypothetical protein